MSSGRGRSRGSDRSEDPNLQEQLKREREEISELKQSAYKSALWALRMDHQKINWRLELAIGELKKALKITEEVHNKIVRELDNEFSQAGDEAKRRVEANRKVVEDKGIAPISENKSTKMKKTNEDEGVDSRVYGGNIVGKAASIKWAGDGKFKEVVAIDYDMENGKHLLYHVSDKLYEWLDLNEMSPEDIEWDHSRGSGRGVRGGRGRGYGQGGRGFKQGKGESSRSTSQTEGHGVDEIEFYDINQLGNMVMKVLEAPTPDLLKQAEKHLEKQRRYLNIGLQAIAKKAATFGAEVPAQNPSVPHDDGDQGCDIRGGGDDDGSDDGNQSGDDENKSGDGGNINFDEKHSGDDDKRGSIGSGSGRSSSGADSGSKKTGSSKSSSDSSSSSSSSGQSGNGIEA